MTTYYEMNEDFLMHFGVPGMKWGHRKQRINKSTSSLGGLIGTRYGKSSTSGTTKKKKSFTSSYTKSYQEAASRQSKKAKKFQAKASKAEAKSKEYSKVAKKSAELDKKVSQRLQNQSAGHRMVSRLLDANGSGNKPYSTMRTLGVSRGKAIANSLLGTYNDLTYRDNYSKNKKKK